MKTANIIDIINKPFEDHYEELDHIIEDVSEYEKAQNDFHQTVKKLEPKLQREVSDLAATMECISKDVAFNEGFKLAVRLILSSLQ